MITGSKFLGGVPFCGAILARADEVASLTDRRERISSPFLGGMSPARMGPHKYLLYGPSPSTIPKLPLPSGVSQFVSGFDVDPRITGLAEALPTQCNYGLLLRWNTALFEFERYS